MGFYVAIEDADFAIPETEEVLQALKDANTKYDHAKHGGSYGNGERKEKWFSWMTSDYDKTVTSVKEVFDMLGFDTHYSDIDGKQHVVIDYYDSKIGQEDIFLYVVAPWVNNNSYIAWRGEDDSHWKHIVDNGVLKIMESVTSEIIYGQPHEITFPNWDKVVEGFFKTNENKEENNE